MEDPASQDRTGDRQPGDSLASDLLIAQIERENRQLREALLKAEAELAAARQLQVDYDELRLAAVALEQAHDELERQSAGLGAQRDRLTIALDDLSADYRVVTGSSSWTLTAPLRRLMSAVRGRGEQRR
jgi:hypothetical protein